MSNFDHLLPPSWEDKIVEWIHEDIPSFDYGGFVVGKKPELAFLFAKSEGVLSGVPFFQKVFSKLGCEVEWLFQEGSLITLESKTPVVVAKVRGPAANLLQGERVALNLLARSSGIATRAREFRKIADSVGYKGVISGTRKTTPGFRLVEKYSLLVGGCDPHRMDLSSMIMLKDNHVWSTGSITEAVKKAQQVGGFALKIEVECRSLEEALEACRAGADVVMLDNFSPTRLKEVAPIVKQSFPHVLTEGSGGLNLDTLADYLCEAVDIYSVGNLTQSVPHVDFSLKIQQQQRQHSS